jgi:hypothetical protein
MGNYKWLLIMKIFMLQTLNLINSTQPKRAENIVNNSRVIERDNKPPYFILNENKNNK